MCWLAPLLRPKPCPRLWRISRAKQNCESIEFSATFAEAVFQVSGRLLNVQMRSSKSICGRPGGRRRNAMSSSVSPCGVSTVRSYWAKYRVDTNGFVDSTIDGRSPGGRRIIANSQVSSSYLQPASRCTKNVNVSQLKGLIVKYGSSSHVYRVCGISVALKVTASATFDCWVCGISVALKVTASATFDLQILSQNGYGEDIFNKF